VGQIGTPCDLERKTTSSQVVLKQIKFEFENVEIFVEGQIICRKMLKYDNNRLLIHIQTSSTAFTPGIHGGS